MRQRRVAQDQATEIDGDEAGRVQERGRGERQHAQREGGQRIEAGQRHGGPPEQLDPAETEDDADDGAPDQLAHDLQQVSHHGEGAVPVSRPARATTSRITGASLSPLSASSAAAIRRGNGSRRNVAKTAAASVEVMTAAIRSASPQAVPSSQTSAAAVTATLTTTPTVASVIPGPTARRTSDHRVVRPPSARMTTSAATPRVRARA